MSSGVWAQPCATGQPAGVEPPAPGPLGQIRSLVPPAGVRQMRRVWTGSGNATATSSGRSASKGFVNMQRWRVW